MSDTTQVPVPFPVEAEPERITRALSRSSAEDAPAAPQLGPAVALSIDEPRYSVGQEVGRGGMGTVLSARDNDLLREVAMKVLGRADAEQLRRFVQEAQVTSQLDHPSVLPVYDLGVNEQGQPFFTMKLVRQHLTLGEVIDALRMEDPEATRRYTFERRVQLIQQVCHALHYAHLRGVVHRDIKPANVVLGPFGEVYLVDWGIAKLALERDEPAPDGPPPQLVTLDAPHDTDPGMLVGTPAYMAPEQIRARATDPRSDIYSLCAVAYELLTLNYYLGELDGGTPQVVKAVLDLIPGPAEAHRVPVHGRVPRSLSVLIARGLDKDPDQRFQSARELEESLQQWLEGTSPVVCGGTCMQRALRGWSRWIDRFPFLAPTVSLVLLVLFARWLVVSVWWLLQFAWSLA